MKIKFTIKWWQFIILNVVWLIFLFSSYFKFEIIGRLLLQATTVFIGLIDIKAYVAWKKWKNESE